MSFDFRVFGVGKDSYESLYYYDGEEHTPLQFHRTHRSVEEYKYRGSPEFGVYVQNPNYDPNDPESSEFIKVANSTSPPMEKQLIIFAANPNNRTATEAERRFRIFHINDSLSSFGRNTVILLNTTGANLFGRINGNEINLPTGASDPISYEPRSGKSTTRIAFALATKEGARLVMSNDFDLSENRRVLLILEPPRNENSFRVAVRVLQESIFSFE
jgi:hypothetical protein